MKKYIPIVCVIASLIILVFLCIFSVNLTKKEGIESTNFDSMIGIEELDLYYEAHLVDLDGECFIYNVYFEDGADEQKNEEIKNLLEEFSKNFDYNGDTYAGYIDVSRRGDIISIFLDLGNVLPQNENISIQGVLKILNNVEGIKKVMINEPDI